MPCPGAKSGWNRFARKRLSDAYPGVTGILPAVVVAGSGSRFEQLRLRHQGTHLPALPLLLERGQSPPQPFDLLHQLPIVEEIQLMKIVEVVQEELHGPGLLGQNQTALLFCDGIVMRELGERAVRDRIAANVALAERHARLPFTTVTRPAKRHVSSRFSAPRACGS